MRGCLFAPGSENEVCVFKIFTVGPKATSQICIYCKLLSCLLQLLYGHLYLVCNYFESVAESNFVHIETHQYNQSLDHVRKKNSFQVI